MTTPIKLLFLHGYTQSGPHFHAKTASLEKSLLKSLPAGSSFHFPTAPHRLQPADLPGGGGFREAATSAGVVAEHWAWWRRDEGGVEYKGLEETWAFLSAYLDENGPFTGVIGFSQGAALAALLISLLERTRPTPSTFSTSHPPLKFGVCYSGFRAPAPYDAFYEPRIATPVLHVIGSLDTLVEEGRSRALVQACEGGGDRVVVHPGGHCVPGGRQWVGVVVGWVGGGWRGKEEDGGVEEMEVPF